MHELCSWARSEQPLYLCDTFHVCKISARKVYCKGNCIAAMISGFMLTWSASQHAKDCQFPRIRLSPRKIIRLPAIWSLKRAGSRLLRLHPSERKTWLFSESIKS